MVGSCMTGWGRRRRGLVTTRMGKSSRVAEVEGIGRRIRGMVLGCGMRISGIIIRRWGRFTSPDPYKASAGAGDPGSWNRYAYVQNDPVNNGDPSGLASCRIGTPGFPIRMGSVLTAIGMTRTDMLHCLRCRSPFTM